MGLRAQPININFWCLRVVSEQEKKEKSQVARLK
jgi:hypothetical protein